MGFRVKTNPIALALAKRENILIMTFDIIYELAQGVRQMIEKAIPPQKLRVDLGRVKVLVIFRTEKNRQIVGGRISEGEVRKGTQIEVVRNEEIIGKGRLVNLQRSRKDVEKLIKGEECGILYEGDVKIEEGDILVIYTEERKKSEL